MYVVTQTHKVTMGGGGGGGSLALPTAALDALLTSTRKERVWSPCIQGFVAVECDHKTTQNLIKGARITVWRFVSVCQKLLLSLPPISFLELQAAHRVCLPSLH